METFPDRQRFALMSTAFHPTGTVSLDEVIAASGISFRLWRLYQQTWLICLIFPIQALIDAPPPLLSLAGATMGLVGFAVSYTWLMWPHPISYQTRTRLHSYTPHALFLLLLVLVFWLTLSYNRAFLWLFVGLGAVAGITFSMRWAFVVLVGLTLLALALGVGVPLDLNQVDWWHFIPLLLLIRGLGLDMIGLAQMGKTIRALHQVQGELARLRVEEERLRLSRDLHDLLGHTLSLIALKSELAGQLINQAPTRAAQEIAEIEQVARTSLREVRKAVAGYRQPGIENELDAARQLLSAAGITFQIGQAVQGLPPAIEATLAWSVREGVTNVIRHSRARHCLIHMKNEPGKAITEIINDGAESPDAQVYFTPTSSGLVGLDERVTILGGTLVSHPVSKPWQGSFRLRVELPLPEQGTSL